MTDPVATGAYEIAFKPPRPLNVTIALAIMLLVIAAPAVFGSFHWHWEKPSPTEYTATGEDLETIFIILLMVINTAIVLPLAVLIWMGVGWPRYAYLVLSVLGLPSFPGFVVLSPGLSTGVCLASIGSAVLLFLPASRTWFETT